ncbi:MAG TPA: hypothetical protein VGG25_03380 [Streptosporangiaceae bacterium]
MSRTERDDSWQWHGDRTATRGPRCGLPAVMSPQESQRRPGPPEQNAGWTIFSYLISGMAVYGLIGWLVSRVTHISVLFPVGMLVGLVLAIVLIVFRYGRP